MKNLIFKLTVFGFILLTTFQCKDENTTETPPPAEPACNTECQDENVAYGIVDVFWFIWNQNIAGQPTGNKDFTINGPQGGTVHVTGTTEVAGDPQINTLHLTLELSGCKGLKDRYNLTFTGTLKADGTFSIMHKAITYSSPQIIYNGTVGYDYWLTDVNGTCDVIINERFTSVSGTICGRSFSY